MSTPQAKIRFGRFRYAVETLVRHQAEAGGWLIRKRRRASNDHSLYVKMRHEATGQKLNVLISDHPPAEPYVGLVSVEPAQEASQLATLFQCMRDPGCVTSLTTPAGGADG